MQACINADPRLVDPAGLDFHLDDGSPAIDTGTSHPAYARFQTLYGIDIARDADGNPRPQGAAYDIGAYEKGGESATPELSIGDVSVNEGTSGVANAVFTVALTPVSAQAVTVQFATADATANAGSDYNAATGTLTFPPGTATRTVAVGVRGDTTVEPDETFWVDLSNAAGAAVDDGQGRGTIRNDDAAVPALSVGDVSVVEGNSGFQSAVFTVTLSAPSAQAVSVAFSHRDRHGPPARGLHARLGHVDLPGRDDLALGHGAGPRRDPLRGERDVPPPARAADGRHHRRRAGRRYHHERRRRARAGVGRALTSDRRRGVRAIFPRALIRGRPPS